MPRERGAVAAMPSRVGGALVDIANPLLGHLAKDGGVQQVPKLPFARVRALGPPVSGEK